MLAHFKTLAFQSFRLARTPSIRLMSRQFKKPPRNLLQVTPKVDNDTEIRHLVQKL